MLVSDVPTAVVGDAGGVQVSVGLARQPLKIDDATVKPARGMGITIWARMN